MVLTVLVLLGLVLITPGLLGRSPELIAYPILIVGLTRDNSTLVVDVGGGVGAYMYENATLEVLRLDANGTFNETIMENDTYGMHMRVPVNPEPSTFSLHTLFVDRQSNYFETNVTVRVFRDDDERMVLAFAFPDPQDQTPGETRKYPPAEDFRWVLPLRGRLA